MQSDEDGEINQNARVIELGDAYCINNQDGTAAAVTYSGAVNGELTKELTVSGFNYLGNGSPVTITLSDVTPNASLKKSKIQFLTNQGTVNKVAFKGREVVEIYTYWREKDDPEEGEGWYLQSDEDGEINQGAREIYAGDAFCINNQDGISATITIPDPLTK